MPAGAHDGLLYVYRDDGWRTCRWLIDVDGRVVDRTSLQYPVRADSAPLAFQRRSPLAGHQVQLAA